MLKSLNRIAPKEPVTADVIIVGAGLGGLFLAGELAARRLRILVLESGAAEQDVEIHPLNAVEMLGDQYMGADHGRFRCLGGTSTRWGGALLPYLPEDLGDHPCHWHKSWGIDPNDLKATLPAVEAAFGVMPGDYEGALDGGGGDLLPGFLPRQPKWPSFRNRNAANLFEESIHRDSNVEVWTDATVTSIQLMIDRVDGVTARSNSGHRLLAKAPTIVLAAGAIETTRLLLLMNRAHDSRLFPSGSPLGQGFHDHISAPIADLVDIARRDIIRMFSFRFVEGGMRNLRFELSPSVRKQRQLPGAFAHVTFTRDPDSGFEGIRRIFQAAQRRQMPSANDLYRIIVDLPWFTKAVWWRNVERRVYPPSGSKFEVHLVTEQAPDRTQCITLAEGNPDIFGLPKARITWRITEADVSNFLDIASLLVKQWHSGRLGEYARLEARPEAKIESSLHEAGGIYHPAGTTRIGSSADVGVVDASLNVHGIPGLRALSTSVFPTIGGSSPSLALVQLALRMAEDISALHTPRSH